MSNNNENISGILFDLEKISNELKILIPKYNKFFSISEIFTSENGGKTRLNRQVFNENHEEVQSSNFEISLCLDESLSILRDKLKEVLILCGEVDKPELVNMIFDDENFIQMIEMNLRNSSLSMDLRIKYLQDIKNLLILKNRIFNLKYFLEMFDTEIFDKYINK